MSNQRRPLEEVLSEMILSGKKRTLELPGGLGLAYLPPQDGGPQLTASRPGKGPGRDEISILLRHLKKALEQQDTPLKDQNTEEISFPDRGRRGYRIKWVAYAPGELGKQQTLF